MSVRVDELADVLAHELEAYDQEISDGLKEAVLYAAKVAVNAVRAASPRRTGDYAKGWTKKKTYEDRRTIRITVHNPKEYRLTHLLEFGHAKRGGGRVKAVPHIAKAQQEAEEALEDRVKVVIG